MPKLHQTQLEPKISHQFTWWPTNILSARGADAVGIGLHNELRGLGWNSAGEIPWSQFSKLDKHNDFHINSYMDTYQNLKLS